MEQTRVELCGPIPHQTNDESDGNSYLQTNRSTFARHVSGTSQVMDNTQHRRHAAAKPLSLALFIGTACRVHETVCLSVPSSRRKQLWQVCCCGPDCCTAGGPGCQRMRAMPCCQLTQEAVHRLVPITGDVQSSTMFVEACRRRSRVGIRHAASIVLTERVAGVEIAVNSRPSPIGSRTVLDKPSARFPVPSHDALITSRNGYM